MTMKKDIFIGWLCIISLLIISIVGLTYVAMTPVEANSEVISVDKVITANGKAAIKVSPDVAYINVGVNTEGKEVKQVQEENTRKMIDIMKVLKSAGIEEKDIKTINYSINPKYEWNKVTNNNIVVGYTVSNMLEVTVKDITKVGTVIDKVVSSGSNSLNGIRFGLQDETGLYNQALELAVQDARSKAEAMGKGAGITKIEVRKIMESGYRIQPLYLDQTMSREMVAMDSITTPVSEGELEVVANVVVEFNFK